MPIPRRYLSNLGVVASSIPGTPHSDNDVHNDSSYSETESDASDFTASGSITAASDDYSPADSKDSAGGDVWVAGSSDSESQRGWSPDSDGIDGDNNTVLTFGFDMDAYPPFEQLDPNMLSFISSFNASKSTDSNPNGDSESCADPLCALGVLERFPVGDILFAPRVEAFQRALLSALLLPLHDRLHCRCLDFYWKLFREVVCACAMHVCLCPCTPSHRHRKQIRTSAGSCMCYLCKL